MRRIALACVAWLMVGLAHAAGEPAVRRQVQGSMLVTGTIAIDATGAVTAYTLDQPDKLPVPVVQLLQQSVPTFRFSPALHDAHPVAVQAKMSLQMLIERADPEHFHLHLGSTRFVESDTPVTDSPSVAQSVRMAYPYEAAQAQVGGTVYVVVRFDRSGRVLDADVQQVNLHFVDSGPRMAHWREVFAKPALTAVRRFRFYPPTTGEHAGDATFTGVLPVMFRMDGEAKPHYGQWDMYVPGPRQDIAWLHEDGRDASQDEAVPAGEFALRHESLRLLAPPGG